MRIVVIPLKLINNSQDEKLFVICQCSCIQLDQEWDIVWITGSGEVRNKR